MDGQSISLNELPARCPICNVRLKGSLRIGKLLNDLSPRHQCLHHFAATAGPTSNRTWEVSEGLRYCSLFDRYLRASLRRAAQFKSIRRAFEVGPVLESVQLTSFR